MTLHRIGMVDVDSGTLTIGDSCYTADGDDRTKYFRMVGLQDETNTISAMHMDSSGTITEVKDTNSCNFIVGKHGVGQEGEFITVSSGYGDGTYPVYAEVNSNGRVARVVIEFIGANDAEP